MEIESSVSAPWPRPCDVVVKRYYDRQCLIDDLIVILSSIDPTTVTERRLRMLTISEHLLAYRGFGMAWPKVVREIISKLEEQAENITTFDVKEYTAQLQELLI
jgi:hypothetical protein